MLLQKELLVNTSTNDAPKAPDLTDCPDSLPPVTKYKACHRVEQQSYLYGQRTPPSTFKATISPTWLERYLVCGFYKKPDGFKWTFYEIDNDALFAMYETRRKKVDPKRQYTFLRERKLTWARRI